MRILLSLKLHWQILIALLIAVLIGVIVQLSGASTESGFVGGLIFVSDFVGKLFLNALKMIVLPLIVTSIILGILNIGGDKNFGRLGLKTVAFYLSTSFLAVVVGLLIVNGLQPGDVPDEVRTKMEAQAVAADDFMGAAEGKSGADFAMVLLRMFPTNIFDAAADNGQLLGVIVFSLLFGFFVTKLNDEHQQTQHKFWESLNGAITKMTDFIIRFAPLGVLGLVTPIIINTGWDLFRVMITFALTVLLALGTHFLVTMPIILSVVARVNPLNHYRAMASALLTAFSTASSASTLPVTMKCVNQNAGVSKRITSFTLPLGATVNMDGTALYECVVVIFLAQLYGIEMGLMTQFTVVIMALLTSIGVAGIPSASLVAIVVILGAVGFPPEIIGQGVGIVLVVDRILDMTRTAVNIFGDSVGAVTIARTEGEEGLYADLKK